MITVGAMTIMVRMQSAKEKEREFSARLFEKQIGNACLVAGEELVSTMSQFIYQLKVYGVLYPRSMTQEQADHFIAFVENERNKPNPHHSHLSLEKTLLDLNVRDNVDTYFVSLDEVVQQIRNDLNVVHGDVREEVEHFVRMPYNLYDMIKRPNLVDEGLRLHENVMPVGEVAELQSNRVTKNIRGQK